MNMPSIYFHLEGNSTYQNFVCRALTVIFIIRTLTVVFSVSDNTRCRRCNSGSYCPGDGTSTQCASECDTDSCEVNATEHSFGGYDTCAPCPEGWVS